MSNLAFETHKIIHKLEDAGIQHLQAEAITEALVTIYINNVVTKEYLDQRINEVEQRLEQRINEVEQKLEQKFTEIEQKLIQLEYKMVIKMGTMFVVAVGVILGSIKFMH